MLEGGQLGVGWGQRREGDEKSERQEGVEWAAVSKEYPDSVEHTLMCVVMTFLTITQELRSV